MSHFEFDHGTVIDRTTHWTLAVNRNQASIGGVIMVLNRACEDIRELAPVEWASLQGEVVRLTAALDDLFAPDHNNYAFLMNIDQQVHLHVTPRHAGSRLWRDMEFTDPDYGIRLDTGIRILEDEHLGGLAAAIRNCLR